MRHFDVVKRIKETDSMSKEEVTITDQAVLKMNQLEIVEMTNKKQIEKLNIWSEKDFRKNIVNFAFWKPKKYSCLFSKDEIGL